MLSYRAACSWWTSLGCMNAAGAAAATATTKLPSAMHADLQGCLFTVDWFGLHECSGSCTGEKCQSNKVVGYTVKKGKNQGIRKKAKEM
eukprot:142691-Pelagomonas_calceolata.AAC.1